MGAFRFQTIFPTTQYVLLTRKLVSRPVVQELRTIAEEYGPVENVTIIKNHQTNHSKGCGFIKYVFREDAMDALAVRCFSSSCCFLPLVCSCAKL
jgi:hypothetical protein